MKIASGREMAQIDGRAIREIGIPGVVLMENAGRAVFESVQEYLSGSEKDRILILCGTGNNGGDGLVAARHLYNAGWNPEVFLLGENGDLREDAALNLSIALKSGITVHEIHARQDISSLRQALQAAGVVVDAIFGTGLTRPVEGLEREVIEELNCSGAHVVAVDIPSGINADTGKILGVCVQADQTVTMALPKRGLLLFPGAAHVGELLVADIGIPKALLEDPDLRLNFIEPRMLEEFLPERPLNAHKGDCGKALILAGSPGLTGAAALAGQAALRAGAGLVTLGIPRGLNPAMEAKLTEVMTLPLPETPEGGLSVEALDILKKNLTAFDVVAAGPGLGRNPDIARLLSALLLFSQIPVILDADAINAVATLSAWKANCPLVLTPHPGEMARLRGKSVPEIMENPLEEALAAAVEYNAVLILKGAHTIIATPSGEAFLNGSGNPGMATAGMGDVLTGVIAGLMAQGASPEEAALAGVYLHGAAGDLAFERIGRRGFLAGDLLPLIPEIMDSITGGDIYA